MEFQKVENFELCFDFDGCGANIRLLFDKTILSFVADDSGSEPLSTLLESTVYLEDAIVLEDYECVWRNMRDSEIMKIQIIKDEENVRLSFDLYKFDEFQEINTLYNSWKFELSYLLYRKNIVTTCLRMLKRYGIRGFNDKWTPDMPTDCFSINTLLAAMGHKITVSDGELKSDIFEELKILMQTIEGLNE